jgi:hypothetical protein
MPKSKRIVVDASVARSAGWETSLSAPSLQCRQVLRVIEKSHEVVFNQECLDEWKKHASNYARDWLAGMHARKKVVRPEDLARNEELRSKLSQAAPSGSSRAAIEKDAHLVEAALQTDQIVISRDEIVRGLFRQCCPVVSQIRNVLWANPEIEAERVAPWLKGGAKEQPVRKLGAQPLNPAG